MTKKLNVFHKEASILEKVKQDIGDESISKETLEKSYQDLASHYEKLLKETKVLTSVSDRLHTKLNDANQQLNIQKNEIGEVNEELQLNNQVLQDTINMLMKAKVGQKASSIVLLIAIVLFIFSEWFIEPIIEENTTSEYTGLFLKGIIALLLKPIDIVIERFLMRRAMRNVNKQP
jgi:Rad3-related DNA helicase